MISFGFNMQLRFCCSVILLYILFDGWWKTNRKTKKIERNDDVFERPFTRFDIGECVNGNYKVRQWGDVSFWYRLVGTFGTTWKMLHILERGRNRTCIQEFKKTLPSFLSPSYIFHDFVCTKLRILFWFMTKFDRIQKLIADIALKKFRLIFFHDFYRMVNWKFCFPKIIHFIN